MNQTAKRPTLTADKNGRPYAKLSELRMDGMIELDSGFTCAKDGLKRVRRDAKGFYFTCNDGHHYLDGQADDGKHCIGVYNSKEW